MTRGYYYAITPDGTDDDYLAALREVDALTPGSPPVAPRPVVAAEASMSAAPGNPSPNRPPRSNLTQPATAPPRPAPAARQFYRNRAGEVLVCSRWVDEIWLDYKLEGWRGFSDSSLSILLDHLAAEGDGAR